MVGQGQQHGNVGQRCIETLRPDRRHDVGGFTNQRQLRPVEAFGDLRANLEPAPGTQAGDLPQNAAQCALQRAGKGLVVQRA